MLTPEQLARLPASVVELWQQVEEDTLADMCRRISKMDGVTDTAAWQAWRLEQTRLFRRDLTKRLAQMLGRSETEVRKLLSDAGTQTLAADDAIYKLVGKNPLPPNESPALSNLLNAGARQTQGSFVNITATTANTATGQFERALDRAWLQTSSGAFDYKTAVRQAVSDLADKGLEAIEYPSGHTDTLEVAVRRAVLTGVNQTAGKLQTARMNEMGCEFVEVTAHAGARPSHAEWQGKVYHRGGAVRADGVFYPDFETATGYGTGEGLCGWNCRHNFYPYYPEISERVYSDERLAELDARNIEYGGKMYTQYEINQMQRGMERRVRKCKRQFVCEEAAGLDSTQSAVRLKNAREQLKNFAYDTGGRVDSARTGVNGFGRSEAGKATWLNRQYLADPQKHDIIQAVTGARITNQYGKPANAHAERYYGLVRSMNTDTFRIAQNTGFPESDIRKVKQYLFMDEHDLGDGRLSRFDCDFSIAQSWQRLIDGKPEPHDITLLRHEIMERGLVESGMPQRDAHIETSKTYNYKKEADAYYGSLRENKNG